MEPSAVNSLVRLANNRPLVFSLTMLFAWMLLTLLIVATTTLIIGTPITSVISQSIGTLSATGILLLLAARLGWLSGIGITRIGSMTTWLVTILIGAYITLAYLYSFFGDLDYQPIYIIETQEARALLPRQFIVGFVEETVFRGFILFVLIRVWGKSKSGILAAVLVQAALFGVLHALQVTAGVPLTTAFLNVISTFVFGIWMGTLVLSVSTIWPAIFLHALANFIPLSKGLYSPWINPVSLQDFRAILFELPLVLIGMWVIWKRLAVPMVTQKGKSEAEIVPESPIQT